MSFERQLTGQLCDIFQIVGLPVRINDLVQHFEQHIDSFKSGNYNETRARIEFIDPFFKELGWDMENSQGFAEAYKDVIHEDAIKVEGSTKAPDYSFRIGGQRKFFLEAKKPSVNVKEDVGPAYQLRRYAWNAGLPVSILTDFEEFSIYDTTIRPNAKNKASTARIFYCTYKDYAEKWDYIASIFSKDAILKGSFDQFLKDAKKKKGTTAVDKEFLKEMEKWRTDLAKNIALRNTVEIHALNYVVQATIDRILFLRICEDRNIEEYGRLQKLAGTTNIYKKLTEIFEQADEKYNSGLFHFHKEKDNPSAPDEISLRLKIDDKILKEIITALYYPSPYEFSVISADILGNVYEQFLGKVIRLTTGGQAKVEEKPEVKKAGGVYYTPQYIVKYIVENTVGELLKNKTPMMVAGKVKGHTPLRILDPACGSGSFLIYAYQYLLDWHRDWYEKDIRTKGAVQAKKWNDEVYQGPGNHWYLTTREKKRILLNNIFGVDIDHQAVEVTKLNLLLKVLEGENRETLGTNLKLFQERALPDLSQNIKCGNSLVGSDFYRSLSGNQKELFETNYEEKSKINVFDWENEFSEVIADGGFDAVLGNPPWVSAWTHKEDAVRDYLLNREKLLDAHWDFYLAFLLRSYALLDKSGLHGLVYPTSLLTEKYSAKIREFLLENKFLVSLSVFGEERVFAEVSRKTCLVFLNKLGKTKDIIVNHWEKESIHKTDTVAGEDFLRNKDFLISVNASVAGFAIRDKILSKSIKIGNLFYVNYGAQISSKVKGAFSQDYLLSDKKKGNAKKCLRGDSINRYRLSWDGTYLDYQPEIMYGPRHPKFFEHEKIIVNKTSDRGYGVRASLDTHKFYCDQRNICLVPYESLKNTNLRIEFKGYEQIPEREAPEFYLGLINSKLVKYFFKEFVASKNLQGEYSDVLPQMVRSLPVFDTRKLPGDLTTIVRQIREAVTLINSLIEKETERSSTPQQLAQLQRQIEATDNEIDRLIYQLYGLTEVEIKIVEGGTDAD